MTTAPGRRTSPHADPWDLRSRLALRLAAPLAAALPEVCARRLHRPVFVIGCGRSGSTLLHELLAVHPRIAAYPSEANELWHPHAYPWHRAVADLPPIWINPYEFIETSVRHRPPGQIRRLRAHFGAYQLVRGRPVFVNKSVMLNFMLPYVLDVAPQAQFIHLVRDGRAVALSYAKYQRETIRRAQARYAQAGFDWPLDRLVEQFAWYWRQTILELERQHDALDLDRTGRWCEVRYEDLCADPRRELQRIAAFLYIDSGVFAQMDLRNVASMNRRYRDELDAAMIEKVEAAARPALMMKGYA